MNSIRPLTFKGSYTIDPSVQQKKGLRYEKRVKATFETVNPKTGKSVADQIKDLPDSVHVKYTRSGFGDYAEITMTGKRDNKLHSDNVGRMVFPVVFPIGYFVSNMVMGAVNSLVDKADPK